MGYTLKTLFEIGVTAGMLVLVALGGKGGDTFYVAKQDYTENSQLVVETTGRTVYKQLNHITLQEEQDEIRTEIMYGEIELLAQVIEAEAGNQDELGKRYVADVILNRVDSALFPDTIEEVIYQAGPTQFSCMNDGNFNKAGWQISEESFRVAFEEYTEHRVNQDIMYYRTEKYSSSGTPAFKHGDHYFSTLQKGET